MEGVFQDIANKMTYVPVWVTYVGIFVPIFLSIVVLMSQIVQNKMNKKLQKSIHNHQVGLKRFDSILDIYFAFSESVDVLSSNKDNIKDTLSNKDSAFEWNNRLVDVERKMCRKYDFALMLLGEKNDLVKKLKEKMDAYSRLVGSVLEKTESDAELTDEVIDSICEMNQKYIASMSYDEFDKFFSSFLNINSFIEGKDKETEKTV